MRQSLLVGRDSVESKLDFMPKKSGLDRVSPYLSPVLAQAGDEAFNRLTFEPAGAKRLDGPFGFRRRFLPPCFDPTLAQQTFEHLLFVRRQRFGLGQDAI
jgi:hypothetical protein